MNGYTKDDIVNYLRSNSNTFSQAPMGTDLAGEMDLVDDRVPTTASSLSVSRSPESASQSAGEDPHEAAASRAPRPCIEGIGGGSMAFLCGKDYGSPMGKSEPTSSVTPLLPKKAKRQVTPFRMENMSLMSESMEQENEPASTLRWRGRTVVAPWHRVVSRCSSFHGSNRVLEVHQKVYVHASGACTPCPFVRPRANSATATSLNSSLPPPASHPMVHHRAVHSANDADFFVSAFSRELSRELSQEHIHGASPSCSASRTEGEDGKMPHYVHDTLHHHHWRLTPETRPHSGGVSSSHRCPVPHTVSHRIRQSNLRDHLPPRHILCLNRVMRGAPELLVRNSLSLSGAHLGGLDPINTSFPTEGNRRITGSLESPSLLLSQSIPSEATMIDKGADWGGGTPGSESLNASNILSRQEASMDEVERQSSSVGSPQSVRGASVGERCFPRHAAATSTQSSRLAGMEKRTSPKPCSASGGGTSSLADDATQSLEEGSGEDEFNLTQRPQRGADRPATTLNAQPALPAQRRPSSTSAAAAVKGHKVPDALRQYADAVAYAKSHHVGLSLKEILAKNKTDRDDEEDAEEEEELDDDDERHVDC